MKAEMFQDVLGGLVQENTPVRVRVDNAPIAYDIERFEIVDGVAYLIVDSAASRAVPHAQVASDG